MSKKTTERGNRAHLHEVDTQVGNALIEVKIGVDALRTLRSSLMQVAYPLSEEPASHGYVVLADSSITAERVKDEWEHTASVLRPELLQRMTICLCDEGHMIGIPNDPDPKIQRVLAKIVAEESDKVPPPRTDYSFFILKLLIHCWLTNGEPVTSDWLARTVGCSYPAVARVLRSLGSLLERTSDRRVVLRWFPKNEFARMLAVADHARSTVRFTSHLEQPRPVEAHLRRLEKFALPDLAIGGVLGAKHHFPDLDIVGAPRLDLSLHCPGRRMNLDFVKTLDPALKQVTDPLQPATLVVHAVHHKAPLFSPRQDGLVWADPVECLLDLHEGGLEMQATQFLEHLQSIRPTRQ